VFSEIFLVKIWEKFGIHISKLLFKKKNPKNALQNFYTRRKVKISGGKKSHGRGKDNFSLFKTHGLTSPLNNKP
jgi:hypothetical protein